MRADTFDVERFVLEAGRPAWGDGEQWFVEHITGKEGAAVFQHRLKVAMRFTDKSQHGFRSVPVQDARDYSLIQLNNAMFTNFLAVDIDGEEGRGVQQAFEKARGCAILPNVIIASTSGAHALWAIEPVHQNQDRAHGFARDCRYNLTRVVGGDPGYGNHSSRSPLFGGARVEWGPLAPYRLSDIKHALASDWKMPGFDPSDGHGDGRNTELYTRLRELARQGAEPFDLYDSAERWNREHPDPLPWGEVEGVIKSAHSGARTGSRGYSGRARRGGQSTSPAKQRAAQANLELARGKKQQQAATRQLRAVHLTRQGHSVQHVADCLKVAPRSVYRYLRYEKQQDRRCPTT